MRQIKHQNLTWYDLIKPGEENFKSLAEKYNLDPFDIEDCLHIAQRPKLENRKNYLFIILRVPIYNRQTKTIKASEVDLFAGRNFIISVHQGNSRTLKRFFTEIKAAKDNREKFLASSGSLLYELLFKLYHRCFPILDHIAEDLDNIEDDIFNHTKQKQTLQKISELRRNIINLRKIMRTHHIVVNNLNKIKAEKFGLTKYAKKRDNARLKEDLANIWDIVESHQETIEALGNTSEVLISYRLNRIILLLTIVSIIFLPMSLVANLFGINTGGLPWTDNPLGFFYVSGMVLMVGAILTTLFRLKKW